MNKFEKLLEDRGVTRYALSQKSGVPQSVLQRLKDGGKIETLSFLTCIKLAKTLNMTINQFYEALKDDDTWALINGWNDISEDFSVYVEGGRLIRGILNERTVYPYRLNDSGDGLDLASGTAKTKEFPDVVWQ